MLETLFHNVNDADKTAAIQNVIEHATPRKDFFLMLMLSVSMAAFGLLLNNLIVLVGSMLIAPLLYPILSMALGIVVSDEKLIGRSVYTIAKSVGFALIAGVIIGFLFSPHTSEGLSFGAAGSPPSLIYTLIAAIAGFAAAFSLVKPYLNETLPGVAISVALVPPLAAAGVALSMFNWAVFSNALLLFLVNVIGIIFSAMIVFSLFNFAIKKAVTHEAVKEEDKVIKKEAKVDEKLAAAKASETE